MFHKYAMKVMVWITKSVDPSSIIISLMFVYCKYTYRIRTCILFPVHPSWCEVHYLFFWIWSACDTLCHMWIFQFLSSLPFQNGSKYIKIARGLIQSSIKLAYYWIFLQSVTGCLFYLFVSFLFVKFWSRTTFCLLTLISLQKLFLKVFVKDLSKI